MVLSGLFLCEINNGPFHPFVEPLSFRWFRFANKLRKNFFLRKQFYSVFHNTKLNPFLLVVKIYFQASNIEPYLAMLYVLAISEKLEQRPYRTESSAWLIFGFLAFQGSRLPFGSTFASLQSAISSLQPFFEIRTLHFFRHKLKINLDAICEGLKDGTWMCWSGMNRYLRKKW